MTASLSASIHGHVAELRFADGELNFASPALLELIADQLDVIDANPAIRCTVLAAEGKVFCAGANLAGDEDLTGADGMDSISRLYFQAKRLFARKKPMVAAVHGAAVGAGLGLALTADFRVAGPATRFSANFTRLGFHPGFGLTHTLPRLIGAQHAAWMMLSSDRVKPDTALAWGLADRLAGDADVLAEAHRMAAEIAENAPLATVAVRATLTSGMADALSAALAHEHAEQTTLKATTDYAEGVASVFERRAANFTGQ
jgi:enoyl-CoA hydratase/carnithine racemase